MTEEQKQKIRQTHLKLAHGEGWTEEDQEKFDRERNTRKCSKYRNRHRDEFRAYIKTFQKGFRERNPYYYGWKQWNRHHQEDKMTYEQYIAYRKNKERRKRNKGE